MPNHSLTLLPDRLAIIRLDPDAHMPPGWAHGKNLLALIRTPQEITVVCDDSAVPLAGRSERGMRALKVQGPLEFTLIGVLASLSIPLAAAGVSIFALSTFDTDYILVKAYQLDSAIQALQQAGHTVIAETS